MSKQLHKNFTNGQVKSLLKSFLDKKIKINYILQMLSIKRSRFFELLAKYRKDPDSFSNIEIKVPCNINSIITTSKVIATKVYFYLYNA